jgi:hypothetical protein
MDVPPPHLPGSHDSERLGGNIYIRVYVSKTDSVAHVPPNFEYIENLSNLEVFALRL